MIKHLIAPLVLAAGLAFAAGNGGTGWTGWDVELGWEWSGPAPAATEPSADRAPFSGHYVRLDAYYWLGSSWGVDAYLMPQLAFYPGALERSWVGVQALADGPRVTLGLEAQYRPAGTYVFRAFARLGGR
ncbi:hypothetical protein [Oceanithermus sp.]|uniref:hypothetical protein n=1 Tax=Oceanithermus sp. TaxID=2268145 RepID=UPI002579F30E|nr:hypothetical protein [Oceanithermus sp.]